MVMPRSASAALTAIVQSLASSSAASASRAAEFRVRRIITLGLGQLRVARIRNSVSPAHRLARGSPGASQEQKPWVATSRRTCRPNYALKRTVRDEVSGENRSLRPAQPLSLGVRLVREIALWFAASFQSFAPLRADCASASLAVIVQSSALSCAASVSFAAECPALRIIVSGFGQLRVAGIRNSVSLARRCQSESSVASQEQKPWVATCRRTA